ncbi:hypothetical protein N9Z86_00615 [bacterium]|nr:hypothetical protein [bacterium]
MSDFNYKEYLKNNPLLQKTEVNEEKLITESQETTEEIQTEMSDPVMRKGEKGDDSIEKETEKMRMKEDDRTDAEQEGYKDGFEDAKDDIEGALKKMKVSELKAKIKEDIISLLQEDEIEYETPLEEKEEVEIDIEDEVEIEEPKLDASVAQTGLSDDEKEIQDALKLAYDNAVAIGDEKLADQIGNSITFFTRTHVVER